MIHPHPPLSPLFLAAASIAVLPLAPALQRLTRWSPAATRALHRGVVAATVLLVLAEILPECVAEIGVTALSLALAGLCLPALLETRQGATRSATSWIVACGLGLHALTDGLAIAGSGHHHEHALGFAVVLHRIPVALAIWCTLRPHGKAVAAGALIAVGACTLAGFAAGGHLATLVDATALWCFQAFAAGMLLHVVFHARGAR